VVCFALLLTLNLVAEQHIKYFHVAFEASPLLFVLIPFIPIMWPIFRFGALGTSTAILLPFMLASVAIAEGKGPYGWLVHLVDSQYRYAWTLILFYWVHILIFTCAVVAASAMNQVYEIENCLQDIIRDRTETAQLHLAKSIRLSGVVKSEFLSS
jgi:integral membrane sensor domain MASE1